MIEPGVGDGEVVLLLELLAGRLVEEPHAFFGRDERGQGAEQRDKGEKAAGHLSLRRKDHELAIISANDGRWGGGLRGGSVRTDLAPAVVLSIRVKQSWLAILDDERASAVAFERWVSGVRKLVMSGAEAWFWRHLIVMTIKIWVGGVWKLHSETRAIVMFVPV
jgi:hypothetical protein